MQIRTVLCPLDFSAADGVELAMAVEICRTFGARLVIHHNLTEPPIGFARGWDWQREHCGREPGRPEVEARLRVLVTELEGAVPTQAIVTTGPLARVVHDLAVAADLVVLGSHGWSTLDHASVTERVIATSPCPVLTFDACGVAPTLSLRAGTPLRVLVPTDLTAASTAAVEYACDLARTLPVRLDLVHVIDALHHRRSAAGTECALDSLVPSDLVDQVESHVLMGPAAPAIIQYAFETAPAFAILGEHAHGWLRGLLTRDTTAEVMHGVGCPVWVVPPARVAHTADAADYGR
jgi:nucleotide-binding universal stress UspA family protein